mgnify:CR=1 FL=1
MAEVPKPCVCEMLLTQPEVQSVAWEALQAHACPADERAQRLRLFVQAVEQDNFACHGVGHSISERRRVLTQVLHCLRKQVRDENERICLGSELILLCVCVCARNAD